MPLQREKAEGMQKEKLKRKKILKTFHNYVGEGNNMTKSY